jgi:hypothetical protein
MIVISRHNNSGTSRYLLEQVNELSLSYREEIVPDNVPLSVNDGTTIWQGKDQVLDWLDEMKEFIYEWNLFQTDTCYCGKDGSIV